MRNTPLVGPCSRTIPRVIWWSEGGGLFLKREEWRAREWSGKRERDGESESDRAREREMHRHRKRVREREREARWVCGTYLI